MVVLGQDEINSGVLSCKHMQSGTTFSGNIDEIISHIKTNLKDR